MASIDYQGAKKEIEKIFSNSFGERKIVFWYDAPKNFYDDVLADAFTTCKILVCDKNEFEIKKTIEHDDLDSNFLVYIPSEKPIDTENWLLDILMYSDEYYADTVALIMRRFNLTNTDLRNVIETHTKFFDSEARSKKLASYVTISNDMPKEKFKLAMMATLTKAPLCSIESILIELIFDDNNHSKFNELVKFNFQDYFWDRVCESFNYDGDLKIESLVKRFMFTAFYKQVEQESDTFSSLPSFYNQYIINGRGEDDAKYLVGKIKEDRRYEALQNSIAFDLKIEGLIADKEIYSFSSADVFVHVDNLIIQRIAQSLQMGSLDYESFERIIYVRNNSIWFESHKDEYDTLLAAIRFMKSVEKPIMKGLTINDYIEKYVSVYYKADMEYRHFFTSYKKLENPTPEFEDLILRIELVYEHSFLVDLGVEYSMALESQKDWDFVGINTTRNFYQYIQKHPAKKMFVIISDGLRYEVGKELYERIKIDPVLKGGVDIDYAISPLPSETRQGMASLLPHKNITYASKSFLVDGMPTNSTSARDTVLKTKNSGYSAIQYEEINGFTRNELRQYMQDKTLVYIYHDVIDNAGEHNEHKVFDVVPSAIDEIINLVKKLYNNLQISNFFITADHGFFYRNNEIYESQKYDSIVALNQAETAKRYLLSIDSVVNVPHTNEFSITSLTNENVKVITPKGYDLFKTQGAGLKYVHGGASLQETIVPLIHISELRSNKLKDTIRPVGVRLKSISRKVTVRSFNLDFEQYEKVEDKMQPITCETYFVDENNNKVSGEYRFVANSSKDDPTTRVSKVRYTLKNISFDRNKVYYMVLKNVDRTDEYIEKIPFTIDIIDFKLF